MPVPAFAPGSGTHAIVLSTPDLSAWYVGLWQQ